jgi:hypothetical protein
MRYAARAIHIYYERGASISRRALAIISPSLMFAASAATCCINFFRPHVRCSSGLRTSKPYAERGGMGIGIGMTRREERGGIGKGRL